MEMCPLQYYPTTRTIPTQHRPRERVGHREVCYYGGGSRSTRREPPGHSVETDKPERYQKIDLQVKVGDNFDQPRPSKKCTMGVFEKKSCFVIAGASRGLGRSMAISFAKKARRESVMILLSRDMKALKEVETEIKSSCQDVKVVVSEFDQGDLDEKKFSNIFENIFKENNLSIDNFEQAVIVHNAGTLGDNSKYVKDLVNVSELNTHFGVNVTGNILLNSACLNFFTQEKFAHRYVINISSLTAVKAFKSFSLYCTVKAARDMFYKVMTEEEPTIRVLSYAPGPCETDMQIKCRENTSDPEVKQMFESLYKEGNVLECDASIKKLVQILETDTFVSGAHIDYYDV